MNDEQSFYDSIAYSSSYIIKIQFSIPSRMCVFTVKPGGSGK